MATVTSVNVRRISEARAVRRVAGWIALIAIVLTVWGGLYLVPVLALAKIGTAITVVVLGILTVFAAMGSALWLVAMVVGWWLLGPQRWAVFDPRARRRLRRLQLLAEFDRAAATANHPGLEVIRVAAIGSHNRRGTKAWVQYADGLQQDAWFWHTSVRRNQVFVVRASGAWGPHRRHEILYVGSDVTGHGLLASVSYPAWRANQKRNTTR